MKLFLVLFGMIFFSKCVNHKKTVAGSNVKQNEIDCNRCIVVNMIFNNDTVAYNRCFTDSYCSACETNEFGETPLMIAVNQNSKWFVQKLSDHCYKCAKNQDGETAINIAERMGFVELVLIINKRQPDECN